MGNEWIGLRQRLRARAANILSGSGRERTAGGTVTQGTPQPESKFSKERLWELTRTLEKYKSGKANLEARIIQAEDWWKLRHWEHIRPKGTGDPEPGSAWLVNVILSKHSDAVDAYPEPVCLPREAGDKQEAETLSSILPVVMQQNDFAQVWSDVWWYKLKSGTGVYGVFWDSGKLNGLGDIAVQKVDILNLFWEPGVQDIQKSKYLFCVEAQDDEALIAQYPQLEGKLGNGLAPIPGKYRYDDNISTDGKSLVVDCYYKWSGKLHLVKYVGETVLFATEDEPEFAERGLYDHGKYPFIFDPLFPEEGYPDCGYGYVDLCKEPQKCIDILNNCFLQSAVASSTPRWFVRTDGGVNEEEYADLTKKFVHVTGRMDEDSIRQITTQGMPGNAMDYMQMKINEMKETSGNRDVNNGGASASVTAASAIAALQEAGNGLSRDMISSAYRAFRRITELCIELIRQFYTLPRQFRIRGQFGTEDFIQYSNAGIQQMPMKSATGEELGMRLPVFDIEVQVQSEGKYTKQAYNELAVQLYGMGIFNPDNAPQALMMLQMMDFKGRNELMQQIQANGSLQQQLMQWQQMAIAATAQLDPGKAQGLMQAAGMAAPATGAAGNPHVGEKAPEKVAQATGGEAGKHEGATVKKSRDAAREGAMPR